MKCRELKDVERDIRKEVQKQNIEFQYDVYSENVVDIYRTSLATALTVFKRRGYSKKYIQKFAEDFMFILDCPPVFGKEATSKDMIKDFEENYDIDFKQIKPKLESKEQFMKRYKED